MDLNYVTEKALVRELLFGSRQALRAFYRLYVPRLRTFIRSRVGSNEDSEEILQDTVLSALDSLALFSGRANFLSWLFGIARHEIGDYYRKRQLRTIVFSRLPFVEGFVSRALEPSAAMMREEYESRVKRALSLILPHYREILELKYMDGLSVAEIALKLGISFKACESALMRARKAFVVAYEESP